MPIYYAMPADADAIEALSKIEAERAIKITTPLAFYLHSRQSIKTAGKHNYPILKIYLPKTIEASIGPSTALNLNDLKIILCGIQYRAGESMIDSLNLPISYDDIVYPDGRISDSNTPIAPRPSAIACLFHDYHRPLSDEVPGWFGLMLTGHWNRGHLAEAQALERSISSCRDLAAVIDLLETAYQKLASGGANLEGSYARRIQFSLLEIDRFTARTAPLARAVARGGAYAAASPPAHAASSARAAPASPTTTRRPPF